MLPCLLPSLLLTYEASGLAPWRLLTVALLPSLPITTSTHLPIPNHYAVPVGLRGRSSRYPKDNQSAVCLFLLPPITDEFPPPLLCTLTSSVQGWGRWQPCHKTFLTSLLFHLREDRGIFPFFFPRRSETPRSL